MLYRLPLLSLSALLFLAAGPAFSAPGYNKDVRPILSENCFACHGPDSAARKAGLRLDQPGWDSKTFLSRVLGGTMPPASSHKTLTTAQKDTLKSWVASGAKYEKHWSFQALSAASAGSIDSLIQARLKKEGLDFSPEAGREEWLRRVTLDLTGLPPTLPEIDAFLADNAPGARERVVDRLLASPHFGEQFAIPWLDLARYGDSYGYQSDQLETVWPWRDWVVSSFNQNLPYDKFITYQLAGDLVPNTTKETRLATAFNRLHRMTNEGGSVAEEWRLEAVADRVKTFGTAFLGLTLECARCHDHKFDPIKQSDFYRLSAFFNSIDEYGLYDAGSITPTPSILLPNRDQARTLSEAKEGILQAERALESAKKSRESAFQTWLISAKDTRIPSPDLVVEQGATTFDGDNGVSLEKARFTRHTPFTISFRMKDTRGAAEPVVVYTSTAGTDTGPYGYDLMLESGVLTAHFQRHWPGNAIAVKTVTAVVPKDQWIRVAVTYDGSSKAAGLKIFVNGKPAETTTLRDHLWKGTGTHALTFGQRFRDKGFKGGQIDEVKIYGRALTGFEFGNASSQEALREFYFSAIDTETREAQARLTAARERIWRAEDPMLEVMDMEELPAPRPAFVLSRGAYDAPRTVPAPRGLPEFLTPKSGERLTRLDLAKWLTDGKNPLTARVAVNRFWQQFFGRGLVETSEDFGVQGRLPTHPELLDALALDFQKDWNVKRLVKEIVLSRTYCQTSAGTKSLYAHDPQNMLLGRGPSGRLSAETLRDLALEASGLLTERLGGSPVSPYQPGDLWREANSMSPAYVQSHGPDLYRRSLYSVVKRTAPLVNMTVFDAPGREVCVARRGATSTPLQALVLLNDTQFVEAARVLGERMLKEGGDKDDSRLTLAFRLLTSRRPVELERRLLAELYRKQRAFYTTYPESAKDLLTVGERKPDASLSPIEVATATAVAQAILNLDATVWKR
ncbi:MAG: DUF1553 domain-containing protein [Armatimonas sp.]